MLNHAAGRLKLFSHDKGIAVFNFEVTGDHTYFVEDGFGAQTALWVHNRCKGAKPLNSPDPERWVKKGGTVWNEMDGTWVYQDWEGNVLRYPGGFPDFEGGGFVRQSVDIKMAVNRTSDFVDADRLAPLGPKLRGSRWHHHENLRSMQEVDRVIHERFTHRGAVSIANRG